MNNMMRREEGWRGFWRLLVYEYRVARRIERLNIKDIIHTAAIVSSQAERASVLFHLLGQYGPDFIPWVEAEREEAARRAEEYAERERVHYGWDNQRSAEK